MREREREKVEKERDRGRMRGRERGRKRGFGISDARVETQPFPGVTCLQRPAAGNEGWLVEEDSPRFLKQGRKK